MNCISGARGAFRSDYSSGDSFYYSYIPRVPSATTVTYEGIFNSTFFKLNSKEEKKALNMEISLASVINPISKENEVWLGTLLKSKYDGQKIDKLIDLSIAIDVSGSMSGSRINMAKESLIQLIQKLNDDDNITISKFNQDSQPVFNYQKVSELKKLDYATKIKDLKAGGGTDILKAFKLAYNLITPESCNKNKMRRIVIITDMEDSINEELTKFCEKISQEGIYVTILGISSSFRTDLAEMTSHIKGANYVVIKESKDISKYLVEDFEYLCYPNASDLSLEVGGIVDLTPVMGIGIPESINGTEYYIDNVVYEGDGAATVYFSSVDDPDVTATQTVLVEDESEILSFPSQLKILEGNKIYVEGGMVLLRLDKASIKSENILKFEINYFNELENKKENIDIEYSFKKEAIEKPNYFSDVKIETALSLFYFAKFNRRFMKICNNENKKKKYDKEYIKRKEFNDEKESIKNFVKEHLSSEKTDKLNEELVNEYLDNMDRNAENAIKKFEEKKEKKNEKN